MEPTGFGRCSRADTDASRADRDALLASKGLDLFGSVFPNPPPFSSPLFRQRELRSASFSVSARVREAYGRLQADRLIMEPMGRNQRCKLQVSGEPSSSSAQGRSV